MSYSWWKLPWLYFISHCLVEIYINILEHSINEWIKPPMCQNLVEISTKQWIHPLGIAIQCIYPLQFFIFHHPVDNSTNLGTSVGYATSVFHFPPSSGILHSYSTLFSDSVLICFTPINNFIRTPLNYVTLKLSHIVTGMFSIKIWYIDRFIVCDIVTLCTNNNAIYILK